MQLAQAAAAVQVASPGRGAEDFIAVDAGLAYRLVDPVLRFTQDGGNLVVHWRDGGHTTIDDYLVLAQTDLPPALTLADGSVISFDQLVASIEGFDPGVIAPAAAAPAVEQAAGGAFNTPFDGGNIGAGPGITDLLLNTELQFGLLDFLDQVFPLSGEEAFPLFGEEVPPLSPPSADDVTTPADIGGEGIPGEVIALLGTHVAFSKELTVDDVIGDSDLSIADFGGSDGETSLEDLTFTLTSAPSYGTLILDPGDGSPDSLLKLGDTFTSADTIWWIATVDDVAEFGIVPDATFTYRVTDGDGLTADATVLITIDGLPVFPAADDVTVDEDGLPAGNDDSAPGDFVVPNTDADDDESTATGTLTYDAGADGFKSLVFDVSDGDPVLDTGDTAIKSGDVALKYLVSGGGTVLTAVTDDANETPIFTVTLTNITATGAEYDVVLLQPLDHEGTNPGFEDDITIQLSVTVADNDDDTASQSFQVTFDDDIPVIDSITDAIVVNQPVQVVNGTYDASVGADELDFLGLVLRDNADYEIGDEVNGVTPVDVTVDGKSFSFFFTVTENKVSDGGDGSVEFKAFFDSGDPDGSAFFTLTVNPDGTYVFELFDNEVLAEIELTGSDFGGGGPVAELNVDSVLTVTARNGDPSLINPSNNGLGVAGGGNQDQNIDPGEAIVFTFANPQTQVSFNLTKWTGGGGTATITLTFAGILGTAVLTIDSASGGDFRTVQIVQDPNLDPGTFFVDDANDTVFVNFEFSVLDVEFTSSTSETMQFNIDNLTFDAHITIKSLDLDFGLSATDLDGDTDTLDDNLTIELVGGDVEGGLTLTDTSGEGNIIQGGTGPDTLLGGGGDDILIGNGGDDTLTGGADADTFLYVSTTDGNDTILDYSIADDTVDLEALFDALQALENDDFDDAAERLAALEYSDDGGKLKLTVNDGTGGADGATDDFSITFDNL
ncbi:MAG: hypothetical protein IIA44_08510, partial [Acidobacteria bacterium]|nr:hypothetical protein [Acidobacteriota bacterium]